MGPDYLPYNVDYLPYDVGNEEPYQAVQPSFSLNIPPRDLLYCISLMTNEEKCELLKMLLDAIPDPEVDLPRQKINNLQRIFARRQKATS